MSLGRRARYKFDNLMARGVGAQILLLAVCAAVLVVVTVVLLLALGVAPQDDSGVRDSLAMLAWKSLMRTMDAGTLGGDSGSWTYLFVFLFATIGGLFVVSALIGVLNQGFGSMLEKMRRGRSIVVEHDHTIILGWGPKVFTVLKELAEANSNKRGASVVILADKDKVAMDEEVAQAMKGKKLRVVTRSGSQMSIEDLSLVSLATSKAVIILAAEPDGDRGGPESDTVTLRTLLALKKAVGDQPLHIVAELFSERTEEVARMVAGKDAALLVAAPLVSRLLVQTGRQSGLSMVYTELLDFGGCEIYITKMPQLVGKTFREAAFELGTSTLMGVFTAGGEMLLPPPFDRKLVADDEIVVISEDDDTIILDGSGSVTDSSINETPSRASRRAERTLVLGASERLPLVLQELDNYIAGGSETIVQGENAREHLQHFDPSVLKNTKLTVEDADVTDHALLGSLDATAFDHILVLSELSGRTQEMADARTTMTLLYLRDICQKANKRIPITSEILDIQSRDLATVSEADDFIVSNTLVSLMISQLSENRHLGKVFDQLFSPEGYELYVKPMSEYVAAGEATYATVCEAAMRRKEIAIGYRQMKYSRDASQGYGIKVNPSKREKVSFASDDNIIVMAEA
ncbi:MAG TPA: hypothetical protein VGM90_35240 [Kofleriaceae bacterium]